MIRTNYIKTKIDKITENCKCGDRDEMINLIILQSIVLNKVKRIYGLVDMVEHSDAAESVIFKDLRYTDRKCGTFNARGIKINIKNHQNKRTKNKTKTKQKQN